MENEKRGIENILDWIIYLDKLTLEFEKAKEDAVIDKTEIIKMFAVTIPEVVRAVSGSWNILPEAKDLDQQEKDQIITAILPIIMRLTRVFV